MSFIFTLFLHSSESLTCSVFLGTRWVFKEVFVLFKRGWTIRLPTAGKISQVYILARLDQDL